MCNTVIRDMVISYLEWCLLISISYLLGQLLSNCLSVWSPPFSSLQLGSCRLQLCSDSGPQASLCQRSCKAEGGCEAERGRDLLLPLCLLVVGLSSQQRFFIPAVTVASQSSSWIQFAVFRTFRTCFVGSASKTSAGTGLLRVWVPHSSELRDANTSKYHPFFRGPSFSSMGPVLSISKF